MTTYPYYTDLLGEVMVYSEPRTARSISVTCKQLDEFFKKSYWSERAHITASQVKRAIDYYLEYIACPGLQWRALLSKLGGFLDGETICKILNHLENSDKQLRGDQIYFTIRVALYRSRSEHWMLDVEAWHTLCQVGPVDLCSSAAIVVFKPSSGEKLMNDIYAYVPNHELIEFSTHDKIRHSWESVLYDGESLLFGDPEDFVRTIECRELNIYPHLVDEDDHKTLRILALYFDKGYIFSNRHKLSGRVLSKMLTRLKTQIQPVKNVSGEMPHLDMVADDLVRIIKNGK